MYTLYQVSCRVWGCERTKTQVHSIEGTQCIRALITKIPSMEWLLSNIPLFLTAVEAVRSRIMVLAVCGIDPLPVHRLPSFL